MYIFAYMGIFSYLCNINKRHNTLITKRFHVKQKTQSNPQVPDGQTTK